MIGCLFLLVNPAAAILLYDTGHPFLFWSAVLLTLASIALAMALARRTDEQGLDIETLAHPANHIDQLDSIDQDFPLWMTLLNWAIALAGAVLLAIAVYIWIAQP